MTVYLHPGTPQQKEIPHSRLEILAVDRDIDLAVLRVLNEPDLPPPLKVRPSGRAVASLEKAVILGYPGGSSSGRADTKSSKPPACRSGRLDERRARSGGTTSATCLRSRSRAGRTRATPAGRSWTPTGTSSRSPSRVSSTTRPGSTGSPTGCRPSTSSACWPGGSAEVEYGQPYRKNGKVHIPVTAHCLDPFKRLKAVGVGLLGRGRQRGKTRPAGGRAEPGASRPTPTTRRSP